MGQGQAGRQYQAEKRQVLIRALQGHHYAMKRFLTALAALQPSGVLVAVIERQDLGVRAAGADRAARF